jgi:hypothetical protein
MATFNMFAPLVEDVDRTGANYALPAQSIPAGEGFRDESGN